MFSFHSNPVWNMPGTKDVLQVIRDLDFVVSIDITAVGETTMLSDVVLADRTFLESWSLYNVEAPFVTGHALRQPVVEPPAETMDGTDILSELSDRIGILHRWNNALNGRLGLWRDPKLLLDPGKKYFIDQILDRFAKSLYGDEQGLDWFKQNGTSMRLRKPSELYSQHEMRIPFYHDYVKRAGDELKENMTKAGQEWMKNWKFDEYQPLPEWRPGLTYEEEPTEYDLVAGFFKTPISTFEDLANIPWVVEVAGNRPDVTYVWINSETRRRKGIKNGDRIRITSKYSSVEGVAWLTEGVHPEAVMMSQAGRPHIKSRYKISTAPMFNELVRADLSNIDPISGAYETEVRVKVEAIR